MILTTPNAIIANQVSFLPLHSLAKLIQQLDLVLSLDAVNTKLLLTLPLLSVLDAKLERFLTVLLQFQLVNSNAEESPITPYTHTWRIAPVLLLAEELPQPLTPLSLINLIAESVFLDFI
jgi:hypothetical protein